MAEKKYLNDVGLADVASHVNTRLKTVTTIPVSADDGAVRLYIGATDSTYTKGHTYQYNSSTSTWVDITPTGGNVDSVNNKTGVVVLDAKDIGFQVDTMPAVTASNLGEIVQYVGATSGGYTNGYFYECVYDSATTSYKWNKIPTQDVSEKADKVTGAVNGDLATLDSNGNLVDSNIASANVVVKSLTSGLLKNDGSVDTNSYVTKVSSATANDFATLDASGNITDSGINKNIVPSNASSSNKLATIGDIPTVSGAVFKGSINYTNLPTTGMVNGDWYDIKDAFTTDNRFEEGSGIACAAGTDVIWVSDDNKWNILTPSGVYSFNGRTGAVSPTSGDYTASDVGLGNVVNTGDSATPINGGTTKFTTGGAYTELAKKADKVSGAVNGNLAGLDANGNLTDSGVVASKVIQKVTTATGLLKDDGSVDTTSYAPSNKAYLTDDTTDTTIDNADYVPFYDTSATSKKRLTWTNIKSVLKSYFDGLYTGNTGTVTSVGSGDGLTGGAITTTGTLKTNLRSYTKLTNDSSAATETANRVYPVALDKSGYLAVNVPWTDNNTWKANSSSSEGYVASGSGKANKVWKTDANGNPDWRDDANTWNANALNVAGYVAAPTSSNANMVWKCDGSGNPAWRGDSNTIPAAYCDTAAGTAAKIASCSGYTLTSNTYLHVIVVNANTAASALTLNVNGKGAKSIYINGSASSSSNYSLPAGSYIVFYDGTNYYFRTDGALTTKGAYNINPSYGSYNINSQMSTTRRITKIVSAGSDGVGVWDDTTNESGWWQSDYFKFPASANSKNIDISFKFDPEYGQSEIVTLTGYILDTSTGKLCLRFGGAVTNAQLIAVDITYTPTYS